MSDVETFTVAELEATEAAGHKAWHDGFCQCWPDNEFSGEAYTFDVEHLIDVMRAARC